MGFADELIADAIDQGFDAFGKAAAYTAPEGGAAVACTVALEDFDPDQATPGSQHLASGRAEFKGGVPMSGKLLAVRASEIATPAHNGRFAIEGVGTLTVTAKPWREVKNGGVRWFCVVI